MANSLAPLCVYTIKHSDDPIEGRSGTFHEKRAWKTAKRLVDDATLNEGSVAVVFAAPERTDNLVAWAVLKEVRITAAGTDYTFSDLTKFRKPLRYKSDLRKRDAKPFKCELYPTLRHLP